ncbi:unnamed protein product, partial [Closterium sp. NIES-54]
VTGSAANSERQEQRTHGRLAQLATTGLPKQGRRTTGAVGDKTATFTQPPPTAPLPSHTPPVQTLAPLTLHPSSTTPYTPTHPPPSATVAAVGDEGGGGAGDATHPPPPNRHPPNPKTG